MSCHLHYANRVASKLAILSLRAYVVDHYSDPPVSNLVLRLVSVYSDDPENKTFYEEVLSGEIKRQFDEMRAAGALEF